MSMLEYATDRKLKPMREDLIEAYRAALGSYPDIEADWIRDFDAYVKSVRLEAALSVLRAWAHWHSGTQYVGSCGTTLVVAEAALKELIEKEKP